MASHFLLLLLALCALLVSADVFESIDCGSSQLYTDGNLIIWSGDDMYIQNGDSQVVKSSSISHVMDTLRVFTSRKKNCYSIKADHGGRVLVRASFYYGNYDGKSSPPTFALQFDGNDWMTVETSIDQVVYYEVIYIVKGDDTSVCVAQTKPNQFPFISALEVRSLGSEMYKDIDGNYALYLNRRVAYGADGPIRYVDDVYDRIWTPVEGGNGSVKVTSDALFIYNQGGDNPPQSVLQNAVTTSNTSASILLGTSFPPVEVPIYINMYFSEVTELDATQNRSFIVYKDDKPWSDPILPPYGNFSEIYASNITVSSNTTFSLVATPDSTLPPIINALEVFFISDVLTDGTNNKDVEGLVSLQNAFDVLQDWNGDPCLPAPYTWDWINCSRDPIPRVTALYLSSFSLSGPLPDLSSMEALVIIDLQNNSLNGQIPDFLGQLPNLKELNLANNQFSGPIPSSLLTKNDLKLDVTSNPDLCTTSKSCETTDSPNSTGRSSGSRKKKRNKLPVILGTTIPSFFIIWAIVGVFAVLHYNRKRAAVAASNAGQNGGGTTPHGTAINPQTMVGKVGMAVMNELKNNINENVVSELAGRTDDQQDN